jgi:hypothetical protein
VWLRLLDRAGPRDTAPLTDDPDLHIIVDGKRIDARERGTGPYVFDLPPAAHSVIVASRSAVPSELGIARDPRMLGVALRKAIVSYSWRLTVLTAADELLTTGFHDYEPTERLRWTDGYATLPIAVFARFDKGSKLELHLGGATRYPDEAPADQAVA